MSTARRSLTEDDVDRYNHTWAFYFLLLLFFTTWLLPLALVDRRSGSVSEFTEFTEIIPKYVATCWTPAELTWAMVTYMNTYCSSAFNKVIRNAVYGADEVSDIRFAYIHSNFLNPNETEWFQPKVEESDRRRQGAAKNVETSSQDKHFIFVRTPLILFVLALCLKLPHIVWTSVFSCGLSHVLETATAAQLLDMRTKSQLKVKLEKALRQTINRSSCFSSVLYLFLKVLTLAVTIAGLLVVRCDLLPRAENVQREHVVDQRVLLTALARNYSGIELLCDIRTRAFHNQQHWTVHCTFNTESPPPTETSTENDLALIWMYEAMFTSLMMLFAVLATINTGSFLIWITRLVPGPYRKKIFRNSNYPMDVYLILNMADLNAGPLVSSDLEECLDEETRRDVETEEEM